MTMTNQNISYQAPDLWQDRGMVNTLLTGGHGASFLANDNFKWSTRFIAVGGGRDPAGTSTQGNFAIDMPPIGTVITGFGGASNKTVTADGIVLGDAWLSLWYELPADKTGSTNFANFKLTFFSSDFIVPSNWVLIATHNLDNQLLKLGTGEFMAKGTLKSLPSVRRGGQSQNSDLVAGVVQNGFSEHIDTNGSWTSPLTIPVAGRYVGDIFTFNHQAGFDTAISITNTTMTVPYLVTTAKAGASFIWLGTKWAFMA
jgi:hypothetical protein